MTDHRTGLIVCPDERLCRLLENELAFLGIPSDSVHTTPSVDSAAGVLLWDSDSFPANQGICLASTWECPILLFGRTIPEAHEDSESIRFLRRPFALADLESILHSLLTGVSRVSSPVDVPARSSTSIPPSTPLLSLDEQPGLVLVNGRPISLTPAEWAIFDCLYSHRGNAVPRETLASLLGGGGNSADVYVCHLRTKIEKPLGRRMIHTVRGVGYRLDDFE
jgi:hypothetical protein